MHGRGRGQGCDVLEQNHTLAARDWMGRQLADGGQPLGAEQPLKSGLASGEKLLQKQEQDSDGGWRKGHSTILGQLATDHVSLH